MYHLICIYEVFMFQQRADLLYLYISSSQCCRALTYRNSIQSVKQQSSCKNTCV